MTSPVTTIFEPNPSRVRNIFICSGVVFCASSRITNESLSVLCVTRKSSVTYSESAAATWMQTVSASPAGSIASMKRIGRPPPCAAYVSRLRARRNGSTPAGSRMSMMYASWR